MADGHSCFEQFARVRFAGPMSLHVEDNRSNPYDAMARDAAFLRKMVANAYAGYRNGFRATRPGKREKSRSAVQSSVTPALRQSAATRASWMAGPETRLSLVM